MAKNKGSCDLKVKERLGKVGGQAVLEGVMMKAGNRTVTTCRKEDGSVFVNDSSFVSVRTKHKILDLPVIRGVVNFVEMLILSFKTLGVSAEALDIDTEKDKEKKAEGKKTTTDIIMIISLFLGLALAVGLFIILPGLISDLVTYLFKRFSEIEVHATVKAVIEYCNVVLDCFHYYVHYVIYVDVMVIC